MAKRTHNVTLAFLRRLSIRDDLRLRYAPHGRPLRAYYTDIDRTHARGEYTLGGVRHHVYGKIKGDRLVTC